MIIKQNIGGDMLYCVCDKPTEILGAFPTLAQAATVQRFISGANMSNDAMAFAVHCMQESEKKTGMATALLWADDMLKEEEEEKRQNNPVRRKKPHKPAAVAPAGSGPARERGQKNGTAGAAAAAGK